MKKKLIAAVTSLVMVATLAPATAFASTTATPVDQTRAEAEAVTAASVDEQIAKLITANGVFDGQAANTVYPNAAYEQAIKAARDNYDNKLLANLSGQGAVKNLAKLEAIEKLFKTAYTDKYAAVETAIGEIPTSLATTDVDKVTTADNAYITLKTVKAIASSDIKTIKSIAGDISSGVSEVATNKLLAAKDAMPIVTQIATIPTITRDNYATTGANGDAKAVIDANKAYEALSADAKAMVGNSTTLKKQVARIDEYKAEVVAYEEAVKAAITDNAATPTVKTVEATEADITAAKKALTDLDAIKAALSSAQQAKVATAIKGTNGYIKQYEANITTAEAALKVIDAIDAIPANVRARDKIAVDTANNLYSATDAAQKALISKEKTDKLSAAKIAINKIKADPSEVKADVLAVMNAIGPKDTLSASDLEAVNNAVAVYNSWYTKGIDVKNSDAELEAARLALLEKVDQVNDLVDLDNAAIAKEIIAQIDALPFAADITSSDKAAYDAAQKAYTDAAPAVKAIISKTNVKNDAAGTMVKPNVKLNNVKAAVGAKLKADVVSELKTVIGDLNSNGSLDDKAKYDKIDQLLATDLSAYGVTIALTDLDTTTQTYYTETKAKYDALVEAAADQNGQTAAVNVVELINKIPTLKADGTDTEEDIAAAEAAIKAAEDAYAKLDAEGKAHVTNYDAIKAAKAKVATAKVYPLAKDIKKVYGYDLSQLSEEQIKIIEDTYAAMMALNKDDKAILDNLTTASERANLTTANDKATSYRATQATKVAALEKDVNKVKDADIAAITLANRDQYDAIINAYEALGEQAKADFAKTDAYTIYQKLAAKYDSFDLAKGEITVANTVYTGEAQQVAVTVKDSTGKTVDASMYKVTYRDNTDVGTATVRVKGDDVNYTGTKSATFEITAASLEDATVSGITTKTYTGKAMTQAGLKVALNGVLLDEENYTVAYKNNTKVGKASVTITGTKNCTGTITKTFVVKPGKATVTSLKAGKKKATVKIKSIPGATYKIAYKQRGNGYKYKTVKTTSLSKTITGLKSGKVYKVKVLAFTKVDGKTYYTGYSTIKTVKVK